MALPMIERRSRIVRIAVSLLFLFGASLRLSAQDAGKPKAVDKPCEGGVAHVHHAYSKCIGGFWHVVSEVEYVCPDGSRQMVTTTEKTEQPCAKPFDIVAHLQGVGKGVCQAAEPAGEVVVRKCVQGFWEEETYQKVRCLDGSFRINGGPIRSVRTTEPCGEKAESQTHSHEAVKETHPPEPGGQPKEVVEHKTEKHSAETSPGKVEPKPKTSAPPPPLPPPPPPSSAAPPKSSGSTYMCGKSVCDCMKQSPPKVCKAGSGCACTKG